MAAPFRPLRDEFRGLIQYIIIQAKLHQPGYLKIVSMNANNVNISYCMISLAEEARFVFNQTTHFGLRKSDIYPYYLYRSNFYLTDRSFPDMPLISENWNRGVAFFLYIANVIS